MQEATISNDQKQQAKQPEPLYQRGKYPSVIDTDDLVFEMGVQLVGNLNKEKLLDGLAKRVGLFEKAAVEASVGKADAEKKLAPLIESNKLYVANNQKLDAELVKIRKELEIIKAESAKALIDLAKVKDEEIANLKKRKAPKKRS